MSFARAEPLAAAALIAATVVLLLSAMRFPLDSRIFPVMILGAMLLAAIMWLVRSLLAARTSGPTAGIANWRQFAAAAALTACYAIAVSLTSYFIPTVIYIPLMAFVLGNRNVPLTIASGLAFTAMIYAVFVWMFERPIPLI